MSTATALRAIAPSADDVTFGSAPHPTDPDATVEGRQTLLHNGILFERRLSPADPWVEYDFHPVDSLPEAIAAIRPCPAHGRACAEWPGNEAQTFTSWGNPILAAYREARAAGDTFADPESWLANLDAMDPGSEAWTNTPVDVDRARRVLQKVAARG